jgi:hypothetical protein
MHYLVAPDTLYSMSLLAADACALLPLLLLVLLLLLPACNQFTLSECRSS